MTEPTHEKAPYDNREQATKEPNRIGSERALRRAYYQIAKHAGTPRLRAWRGARYLARKDWRKRQAPRWPDDFPTAGLGGTGWM